MRDILFLAHRIPYPPNKGDKIRSFHLLRHLARLGRVHLAAFVDDRADWEHVPRLLALTRGETCLRPLARPLATLRSLRGFLDGRPLTLTYFYDRTLARWVKDVMARHRPELVFVYSSAMAQYVENMRAPVRVIDFVDVDSDKWRQYAKRRAFPLSWVYGREARRLAEYEARVCRAFDLSLFVSEAEAALFRRQLPDAGERVRALSNGVDTDYFTPEAAHPSPYTAGEEAIVFTGAMDYWANVDAVAWFASEVFRALRNERPGLRFYIVGARPTADVLRLASIPGVRVTGAVPDVRPYLAHAALAVAPLRVARGIQNKVLEAMAMARPVVLTPEALEGIAAEPGVEVQVARTPADFRAACLAVLADGRAEMGARARARVLAAYGWESHLRDFDRLLSPFLSAAPQGVAA